MPSRTPWDPAFSAGQTLIDAQHRALLDQCNLLAELCPGQADPEAELPFDQALEDLKARVREHFASEAALLAPAGEDAIEDHRIDGDEFEYLVEQIVTTENFSRLELQRFLALWCVGHITESARQLRQAAGADAPVGDAPAV